MKIDWRPRCWGMRLRLHNPWPARQAEYLLRWWPAGSHPPPEGARWWPAGAPEPVGRADTNKGDVTTNNIKADTGDSDKAAHISPQLPIDKQEHEEMHTSKQRQQRTAHQQHGGYWGHGQVIGTSGNEHHGGSTNH